MKKTNKINVMKGCKWIRNSLVVLAIISILAFMFVRNNFDMFVFSTATGVARTNEIFDKLSVWVDLKWDLYVFMIMSCLYASYSLFLEVLNKNV